MAIINELKSFYLIDKLPKYEIINKQFLADIQEYKTQKLDDKYNRISRVDWLDARNVNRPWVKRFLPNLQRKLNYMMKEVGYTGATLAEIWFQQYNKDDIHDWHVHGHNFTGVYYVELENAPKTELIAPYDLKVIVPDVTVGDILIFPSFCIHRAPVVNNDIRKTIISFNFDATGVL